MRKIQPSAAGYVDKVSLGPFHGAVWTTDEVPRQEYRYPPEQGMSQ